MNSSHPAFGTVDSKYYEVATPRSFAERLMVRARDRIYDDFIRLCHPTSEETILDVGVSDVIGDGANVLERRYPYQQRLTAVGLGAAEEFRGTFPEVSYRQVVANEPLPFPDKSFDIVTSNAVLEHVGSPENQRRFVGELMRIGKRVFIRRPASLVSRRAPYRHSLSPLDGSRLCADVQTARQRGLGSSGEPDPYVQKKIASLLSGRPSDDRRDRHPAGAMEFQPVSLLAREAGMTGADL